MTSPETTTSNLFPWGNPSPSLGECCGCQRGPIERYRFNVVIEDAFTRHSHTQLLCSPCVRALVEILVGQSVEQTPQAELNRLDLLHQSAGWTVEQEQVA
jgi:hypothetical protein